ncbi:DUF58 domain-containing protein [uncultured Ilyobacter sp.]|uniref:DUF58 domain-containing protein n=1 Tax=uncultured Ilyobacter sp. TaxID=544433 RepID=UPI0029C7AB5A|nr:DUF58 domain-containing protein [uncultured Ilyobacter sp.]
MLDKDLLKKIKNIEIKSNRLSDEIFSGEYHSFFKGNGMEFSDIRRYSPGDEVKNIDWKVTARQRKAYIKQFKEEREMNFFILIDISESNNFNDKKDLIAEISAVLAFSAIKNNDKVGAIFFSDEVEKLIPLKKGKKHTLSLMENLFKYFEGNSHEKKLKKTSIKSALEYFLKIQKRRSIVFLISDFFDEDYERQIKIVSKRHDLILIKISDKSKEVIPKGAVFNFIDSETGEVMTLENLKSEIRLNDFIDVDKRNLVDISTEDDYVKKLSLFFRRRRR